MQELVPVNPLETSIQVHHINAKKWIFHSCLPLKQQWCYQQKSFTPYKNAILALEQLDGQQHQTLNKIFPLMTDLENTKKIHHIYVEEFPLTTSYQ